MNRKELETKSRELLELEAKIIQYQNTARKKLPDLEAAKKRVGTERMKRTFGIVLVAVVLALFFFGRPALADYQAAMRAEHGFSLMPSVLAFLLWGFMLVTAPWAVVLVLASPDKSDVDAPTILENNKKYNEDLANKEQELRKEWQVKTEELNRLAGTTYGDGNPKYFFQIPFDSKKTYRELKDGLEFYSDSFGDYACGCSMTAGPPFVHDPGLSGLNAQYLRFDGFYNSKVCKMREALELLEDRDYVTIYKDQEYLKEHAKENCRLVCIYDTFSMPVKDQGFYKMKQMELSDLAKALAATWSKPQQFMASGIAVYDRQMSCPSSAVEDTRDGAAEKYAESLCYDDLYYIKQGRTQDFTLYNAVSCQLLEKGFCIMDKDFNRVLCIALTNKSLYVPRINFNISQYEYKNWSSYHGWIAGAGVDKTSHQPDKASTMEYLARFLGTEFAFFDPLMERPAGLTEEQFRFWISCWYRGYKRQHTKE